eukprot:3761689-Amphidinium_carterae.2
MRTRSPQKGGEAWQGLHQATSCRQNLDSTLLRYTWLSQGLGTLTSTEIGRRPEHPNTQWLRKVEVLRFNLSKLDRKRKQFGVHKLPT